MRTERQGLRFCGGNGRSAQQAMEEERGSQSHDGHGQKSARIAEADKGGSGGGYRTSLAQGDDQEIQSGGACLLRRGYAAHEKSEQAGFAHPQQAGVGDVEDRSGNRGGSSGKPRKKDGDENLGSRHCGHEAKPAKQQGSGENAENLAQARDG